jgi:hypothetical protein
MASGAPTTSPIHATVATPVSTRKPIAAMPLFRPDPRKGAPAPDFRRNPGGRLPTTLQPAVQRMSRSFRLRMVRQWRILEIDARPWISVVETPGYASRAKKLLTEVEQDAIVQIIARDPTCGVVVAGTAGVRKVRIPAPGRGKSGGFRVVYYFHSDAVPAFLLTVFAKSEKANLTPAERNELTRVVEAIKRAAGR